MTKSGSKRPEALTPGHSRAVLLKVDAAREGKQKTGGVDPGLRTRGALRESGRGEWRQAKVPEALTPGWRSAIEKILPSREGGLPAICGRPLR